MRRFSSGFGELQEADLLPGDPSGTGPTEEEKRLLDEALAVHKRDDIVGTHHYHGDLLTALGLHTFPHTACFEEMESDPDEYADWLRSW